MKYLLGAIGALVIYDIVQEAKRSGRFLVDRPIDISDQLDYALDLHPPDRQGVYQDFDGGVVPWDDAEGLAEAAEVAIAVNRKEHS